MDDRATMDAWLVEFRYFHHGELDLTATFTIVAASAIEAIEKATTEALPVMFTERAREVITLRSVKRY